MKVLQINVVCGVGSTGRIATDLYKVLEEQGHECVIAYGRGDAPSDIKSIKIGSNFDNYAHVLKTRVLDKHGFGSIKATKEFIKKIANYNPDIIHLHNIHGYYLNIEILFQYLKKANIPIVWTLHDCWTFTGHCSHFDSIGCVKWKYGCRRCEQKREYPASILLNNSKSNYIKKKDLFTCIENVKIVAPSKWLESIVRESFLSKYPLSVINNGIDLKIFKPTQSNFREKYKVENKFIILGVAHVWKETKGLKYLIQLSSQLDSNYKIVVVGVTEKQKYQLPDSIIGIGRTDKTDELAEIYSAADVFVNPTVEEVMGIVNVESLACGTPVITFNTGGSAECIDESCGFVAEKGNIDDIIKFIKEIKSNKKEFYYQNCIDRANVYYDKNKKSNEYINVYSTNRK